MSKINEHTSLSFKRIIIKNSNKSTHRKYAPKGYLVTAKEAYEYTMKHYPITMQKLKEYNDK